MVNKAQLSLFFIFGAIMLIGVALISYISSVKQSAEASKETGISVSSPELALKSQIQSNVNFCVKGVARKALIYIGLHGGYYNVPDPKITDELDETPMYVYLSQNTSPSIQTIEAQISDYMKEQLPICVEGLEFENSRLEGQINWVKAGIAKGKVIVRANYPLSLQRNDLTLTMSDFSAEIPLRLDVIYGTALEIAESQLENKGNLCADCVVELAEKNNLGIDVDLEEKSLVFTIFDNAVTMDGNPYVFSFATE